MGEGNNLSEVLQRHDDCFSSVIQKEGKGFQPLVAEGGGEIN